MVVIVIGGPGTRLPFVVESFLGWSLCISCLAVSGYHYVKSVTISSTFYRRARRLVRTVLGGWLIKNNTSDNDAELAWIPLTTHSRAEIERHTPWQSYLSLVQALELRYPDALLPILPPEKSHSGSIASNEAREVATTITRQASNFADIETVKRHADNELMRALRQDDVCRRLASLAMRPYRATIETTTSISTATKSVKITSTDAISGPNLTNNKLCASAHVTTANHASTETIQTTLLQQLPHNRLLQRISKMWKYLLLLPSLKEAKAFYRVPTENAGIVATKRIKSHENDAYYPYQISIIMPAFHEKGSHLIAKLSKALETSNNPEGIEVIIVDAGGCTDLEKVVSLHSTEKEFGKISIILFTAGGGRGPCLNYGAANATGRILTFCHSDTILPSHWDKSIVSTLEHDGMDDDDLFRLGEIRSNSCAFAFGIDTSPAGLAMPFISSSQSSESPASSYFPPGIRAVETTANLRTHLYSLPYGDQVLSLHARVFHFLGGFPDQCLMEDYELVSLLRRRAAVLGGIYPIGGMKLNRISYERLAIIPGPPALCSPRRWQKFGVIYTTFTNSRLVSLYAGDRNMSADELFQIYYEKDPPKRSSADSPWELELKQLLGDNK
ncbi:hypothetical protein ACHAXM_001715 [Skeletonema potamos]